LRERWEQRSPPDTSDVSDHQASKASVVVVSATLWVDRIDLEHSVFPEANNARCLRATEAEHEKKRHVFGDASGERSPNLILGHFFVAHAPFGAAVDITPFELAKGCKF